MDLVDIDQVLDNLELRESANAAQENSTCNLQNTQDVNAQRISPAIPSDNGQENVKLGSTKSFVGVSQVFNSLYDYSENIQSLGSLARQQYDEECQSFATQAVDVEKQEPVHIMEGVKPLTNSCSSVVKTKDLDLNNDASNYQKIASNTYYGSSSGEETSADIQKFTECRKHNVAKESYGEETFSNELSSDSLTTSSPSSFSSGPSPCLESSIEGNSLSVSPKESIMDDQQSCVQINKDNERLIDESSKEVCTELAESLSAVSLTTENLKASAPGSSMFVSKNCLVEHANCSPGENVGTKQFQNDEIGCQPNKCSEQNQNEITKKEKETCSDISEMKVEGRGSPKPQKVITFCSTMDDISDTELDSMLQEMDIDDVDNEEQRKEKLKAAASCQEVVNGLGVDQVVKSEAVESVADSLNADNFSVASTVEFADMRTDSVNCQTADDQVGCNSIASSFTSSESSLEGEVNHDENGSDDASQDRPQRPTFLQLPTSQASMYANAGLTPPGAEAGAEISQQARNLSEFQQPNNAASESDVGEASGYSDPFANVGKIPPVWVPDNMATSCMQCHIKFTMIKRRHHCRACGKVLCSVCCSQKHKLEFVVESESRVCVQCYLVLTRRVQMETFDDQNMDANNTAATPSKSPNPNNPMEYCSTIPPHRQVTSIPSEPPSVVVPVGVLKKDGSYSSNSSNSISQKARKRKSVMFSDGIAPGSDLAVMESQWGESKQPRKGLQPNNNARSNASKKPSTPLNTEVSSEDTSMGLMAQLFRGAIPPSAAAAVVSAVQGSSNSHSFNNGLTYSTTIPGKVLKPENTNYRSKCVPPSGCDETGSFIPKDDSCLPPVCPDRTEQGCNFNFIDVANDFELVKRLQNEILKFALRKNLYVFVKIVKLTCCMNRTVINFTTLGMHNVGNDEIVILLEYDPPATKEDMTEPPIPKDIFTHLNNIYNEANLGNPIMELSYTCPEGSNFLGSSEFSGFIYVRTTFQCLQEIIIPENPFLVGILIQRSEVPWAKVFPLRLILRLGAQYRYYPCPHISMRNRDPVYAEIAQTIMNFLADFRNYTYTLPCIRGMYIHMEDRQTTVLLPRNRLEDVIKAVNNSSDHILAFGGNFSKVADGHLVCMQNVNDKDTEMYAYSTQAINIQGQPRKVTGANFLVLNESLKSSSGLSGKCSIVEDGLMVQILPSKMEEVRNALKNQRDVDIVCGPLTGDEQKNEIVIFKWVDNDTSSNIGVNSPIDGKQLDGISSLRIQANLKYSNSNYFIRFTEVFILKHHAWYNSGQSKVAAIAQELTRTSDLIARSASLALVPFLDLLVAGGSTKIGLRVTLDQENVCYEAGTRGSKLPPLYMNALDNHLIPSLHSESSDIDDAIVLELIFFILNS